ncbi:MAG: hypothetical protein LKI53_02350 [Bacteroidales bacterium]|jgi:hypothetical protein|nr:hypothetical protein [Bacteroidales bacterium]
MKTKRFDFNWKPLQLQISFTVDGSVPDKQNYNADTLEYTPDYTLTPLILQPCVSILDKDEVLPAGRVNHALTNVRWYETINGVRRLISTEDTNYEITTTGGLAGRIKVKKNVEPKVPITLEFYAEYIDARNSQVSTIRSTYMVSCSSASDLVRVELDAAEQTVYNPLSDPREQTVTATVWLGDSVCPAERYALVWEVLDGSTWRAAGNDAVLDSDITLNTDGSVTIDRWLMGAEKKLRCRVKYSAEGTPAGVELTEASPSAEAVFVRRISKYECEISGAPYNIPTGILRIAPTAVIRNTNGEITNAEKELLPLWYIAKNKATGSLSYEQVGHGKSPILPTAAMDKTYGGVIGLDVVDRGPAGIARDNHDGKAIIDADGKLFIFH